MSGQSSSSPPWIPMTNSQSSPHALAFAHDFPIVEDSQALLSSSLPSTSSYWPKSMPEQQNVIPLDSIFFAGASNNATMISEPGYNMSPSFRSKGSPISKWARPRSNSHSPSSSSAASQDDQKKTIKCPHPGCDKLFYRHYNLKSHLVCHSSKFILMRFMIRIEERPHSCHVCNASFARKHDLQRHVRTLHGFFRSFKCGSCSLSFVRMDSLRRHMINERHAEGLASMSQGNKVMHTFSFEELERMIQFQNAQSQQGIQDNRM